MTCFYLKFLGKHHLYLYADSLETTQISQILINEHTVIFVIKLEIIVIAHLFIFVVFCMYVLSLLIDANETVFSCLLF